MKIIYNNIIPFKGFAAINLFGILFVRNDCKHLVGDRMINHESIHTAQMKEMLWIFFYLWYIVEWFIKLFKYGDSNEDGRGDAYHNISFEREAYDNETDQQYLNNRKHYSWWYYLTHKTHGQN